MDAQTLWPSIAADLAPDGALRDIYVHDVDLATWDTVWRAIQTQYAPVAFTIDGQSAPLPPRAADALAVRPNASPLAIFEVGAVSLACHFFDRGEIEFDLLPADVPDAEALAPVLAFLEVLAALTGRPARLTHENRADAIIVQAEP